MRRPICAACNRNVKISDSSSSVSSQKSSIHKREIHTSASSSEDIMVMVRTRSNSPTSPIPTRRSSGRRLDELIQNNNKEKWNELLAQQQKILEFVNMDSDNMMMISSVEYTPGDETLILETQVELLKRFESLLLLSSLPVPQLVTTPLPVVDEQEQPLPIASWQTQFEYRLTRFKWNISQWFGTLVGDGQIEEQEFDTLGYTKTVVISGVCVTTEPGLLPKVMIDMLERPWK